jgi:hypothetical protein
MRILITGEANYLIGRDNNEYHMVKYIADKSKGDIRLVMDCDIRESDITEFKPDIVFSFNCGGQKDPRILNYLGDQTIPFCLMIDDAFHFDAVSSQIPQRCDAIVLLVKWKTLTDQYRRHFPHKLVTNLSSRYVDVTQFRPLHLEKEFDIFFYGTDDVDTKVPLNDVDSQYFNDDWKTRNNTDQVPDSYNYYPLRKRLRDLMISQPPDKYRTNIFVPQGSWFPVPPVRRASLCEVINKSHLVICTRARSDTLLKKFLEISASGSVILGNYPSDYKDLFENNIVEVNENMSDQEILDTIDHALADRNALHAKGIELAERVRHEHNYECAYTDFLQISRQIIDHCEVAPPQ